MRGLGSKALSWVAIYAIAIHTLLIGIAPAFAANQDTVDPFSVICLHDAGAGAPSGLPSGLVPGHACEHCNLCSAVAPPPAPDLVVFGNLMPSRLLQVLQPTSTAPGMGIVYRPNLARGPPLFV
jgi:hypothetical protein